MNLSSEVHWQRSKDKKSGDSYQENQMLSGLLLFQSPDVIVYSTVTLFARFLGLSTSRPFATDR